MPPFLLLLGGVPGALRTGWKVLTSPPGLCVVLGVAFLGTYVAGMHKGDQRTSAIYEQRIADSIEKNRKFDEDLRKEVAAKAEEQRAEAEQRVAAAEGKVVEYEKLVKSCFVGDDGASFLNGDGGVQPPGRVVAKPPRPTVGGRRGAVQGGNPARHQ